MNYYELLTVGSVVLDKFLRREVTMVGLSAGAGWRTYHNFQKLTLPEELYSSTGYTEDQVQVELEFVQAGAMEKCHYHNKTHSVNIILGVEDGFPNPGYGSCVIHNFETKLAKPRSIHYFKPTELHSFFGGTEGLHFLSVKSPPLETEEGDDFFYTELEL